MFKTSRYNHFVQCSPDRYIAYNARSGAVGLMTGENYEAYKRLARKLSQDDGQEFTSEEAHLIQQLEHGRFVYPNDQDELEAIRFEHMMARYDQTGLGLSIAPTLACNMACEYCYEAAKTGMMRSDTVEAILEFVEKRAPHLRTVDVNWYGGEPLLAMDVITDLTESLTDVAGEHKFDYSASIVTNGYLLTKDRVDELRALRVRNIQITLDGPSRMHDVKRPLKNGGQSFKTIIENIAYATTRISTNIRVNVDRSFSTDDIRELLTELDEAGLRERVGLYFGRLEASTSVCSNISESCYDSAAFSKIETEFYPILLEKGFLIGSLPAPLATVCIAQQISSFLIDPDGDIYRCYNHVGNKPKSMGNVRDKIDYQNRNFRKFFAFDPFENETCRSCDLLPVCLGGCPARRAELGLTGDDLCETWKHNLQPMLDIIVKSRQSQQRTEVTQGRSND